MKLSKLTKITLAATAISLTSLPALADICPRLNGAVDLSLLTVNSNNMDYNCNYTPDAMRLKLYKILLCEQLPTVANYNETCEALVDFSSGKDIDVTADGTTPILDGPVSLKEGSYTHAVILIANRISSKFTQTFSQPIQGNNGVGTTCWSNGNDAKISYESFALGPGDYTKFSASCGAISEASPQWSYYSYRGLWNPDPNRGNTYFVNSAPYLTITGSGKDVHLLSDISTLATVTAGESGRNPDDENGIVSNASYMMGVTKLTPIATMSPNTKNIDLGFKLKDTFFQKITTNNNYYGNKRCSETHGILGASSETGAHACLSTSYATTFDFKILVE